MKVSHEDVEVEFRGERQPGGMVKIRFEAETTGVRLSLTISREDAARIARALLAEARSNH